MAGVHLSRFRGRGVDYLESRSYEMGDDIRNIDWRVTARTGKPHTKIFQEERERPVVALLDLDARMFFATRGRLKSIVAAEIGALIAWAATRRGDRIGGLLFSSALHHEVRPRGGRRGALRFIRVLEQLWEERQTQPVDRTPGLPDALARLRRIVRPGSLVILASDFMGLDESCERHLSRLTQHNDMVALQVLDPIETQVPPAGRYPVSDGKRAAVLDLASPAAREHYRREVVEKQYLAGQTLQRYRIPVFTVGTMDDPAAVISQFSLLK